MKRVAGLLFFISSFFGLQAQTTNYQVYSVYVISIAKYSSWPPSEVKDFKITVLGKSKVFDELTKGAVNKDINGKKIVVNQVDEILPTDEPQIIYVSDGKSNQIADLAKSFSGKPVMIIAEREGLFKKGANFSFVILENNTLRFDINKKELENHQIKISKNLVVLANETI